MPYDPKLDPYYVRAGLEQAPIRPGNQMATILQSASDVAAPYPKALYVEVTPGTPGTHITITPLTAADGVTTSLTLSDGPTVIDWVRVRRVTAIAGGVTVWRIDD